MAKQDALNILYAHVLLILRNTQNLKTLLSTIVIASVLLSRKETKQSTIDIKLNL